MSLGSPKIVVRVPQAVIDDVDASVDRRNKAKNQTKHWSRTEWVMEAIMDKLNHEARSARRERKTRQWQPAENEPRVYEVDGEDESWGRAE